MARTASAFAGLGLALAAPSAFAADAPARLPKILSDPAVAAANPLPDFSYAGYGFGLADIPSDPGTVIDVVDHGVAPDDGKDDAKAILKALAAADKVSGRVTLRFPKGRIQVGEILPIERSDLVLDGAGDSPGGTELYFPRPLKVVDTSTRQDGLRAYLVRENKFQREPDQNIDHLFSEYSWSGAFLAVGPRAIPPAVYDADEARPGALTPAILGKRFQRTLTVETPGALKVGQVVQVQWFAADGPKSAILKSLYGDVDAWNANQTDEARKLQIGSHHWTTPNRPVVIQTTRITAIRGKTVTIGDPLMHDVTPAQPAVFAAWTHLTNVGIQNMRLAFPDNPWFGHHLEQGYNAIYMTGVFDGWLRNLTIHNSDSAILTDNAASLTIAKVRTTGEHKAHYSVHVGAVHNVLVSDLRVENPVIHSVSVNTRSTRSVFQRAVVLRESVIDQHSGSNHQNLFDQLTLHVRPTKAADGQWRYRLWDGGGAGYWKPGHGLFNTHWNLDVVVDGGPAEGETVRIVSGLEGPGARIVGLHGNRPLEVDYTPDAYVEGTNLPVTGAPSLYDHQLAKRRRK